MKKILVITPNFYGYGKIISERLEKKYDKVFYKYDVPYGDFFFVAKRLFPVIVDLLWCHYEKSITNLIESESIKELFIIKGEFLPERILKKWSEIPGLKLIQYQWDSVFNNPNALIISKYTCRNFTFDSKDADNYSNFQYLPLFYYWGDIINNSFKSINRIDILFIGSFSRDRIEKLLIMRDFCKKYNLTFYHHIYISFRSYIKLLFSGVYTPINLVSFRKLDHCRYYYLLHNSRLVLDVPNKNQIGASMRTIESLSLSKKLITTNKNVIYENFYQPDNFCLWPCNDAEVLRCLNGKFNNESANEIYELDAWLEKILL